jgi:hypothetical protein
VALGGGRAPPHVDTAVGEVMTVQDKLRRQILDELATAGFVMQDGLILPPSGEPKEVARRLHEPQRRAALEEAREFIIAREADLLDYFADGTEVDPRTLDPLVRPVATSLDAEVFRFASLHWAVPVSQGYGRRNRFLIWDQANGKLIGIFALADPVFNLGARDQLIGWDQAQRQERLYNIFDAYVLGAIEPYRQLLGGKLAALCTVSDEVITCLEDKYRDTTTVILEKIKPSRPVLITTSSALGRSSVYNRIAVDGRLMFQPIGYSEGFGHFQFSEPLFRELAALTRMPGAERENAYGHGPNWKFRTIRKALQQLGLPGDLLRHGIRRQLFIAPVAHNWAEYLRGETNIIEPSTQPLEHLAAYFRDRWAISRAERRPTYKNWNHDDMRLTPQLPNAPRVDRLF